MTSDKRFPTWMNVPTLAESGVPGFGFDTWFILIGPPGMPTPVAEQISQALRKSLGDPVLRERLFNAGHVAWDKPNGLPEARGERTKQ